jgi:hypothetical protein
MDDNVDPSGVFDECCWSLSRECMLTAMLICADLVICHLLPPPNYQVYEPNVDVLVYYPSLMLMDAILIPTVAEHCS